MKIISVEDSMREIDVDYCATFSGVADKLNNIFEDKKCYEFEQIAELLYRLQKNYVAMRYFLSRHLSQGRWPRLAGAQSFVLYHSSAFYMRINLWPTKIKTLHDKKMVNGIMGRYLSIGECHNHSYDFFSICLFGPGYESQFYRANIRESKLQAGDYIDLEKGETIRLCGNDVLFVENDVDFHIQQWPQQFSVTLNIVPFNKELQSDRQYIVDPTEKRVRNVIQVKS